MPQKTPEQVHACMVMRSLARGHAGLLMRSGALATLVGAAAPANASKLRGWALSAIAHLSQRCTLRSLLASPRTDTTPPLTLCLRSVEGAAHGELHVAVPNVIEALEADSIECNIWAAEALGSLCMRHGASAQERSGHPARGLSSALASPLASSRCGGRVAGGAA